jgi:hypothetical protein
MTFYIRLAFTSELALRIKGAAYFTKSQLSETDNRYHPRVETRVNSFCVDIKMILLFVFHTAIVEPTQEQMNACTEDTKLLCEARVCVRGTRERLER